MTLKLNWLCSRMNRRIAASVTGMALVLAVAGCATGGAEPSVTQSRLAERYPPGTIKTLKTAEQAKADVEEARAQIEARFAAKERTCYERFFTTSCLDAAKEERRLGLVEARAVEVEANALRRRAKVDERDAALAERQAKDKAREPVKHPSLPQQAPPDDGAKTPSAEKN